MALHRLGVALRVVVLTVGEWRLGDERPEAGVVSGVRKVGQLLVGHRQVLAQLLEARGHLSEAPFDEGPGHRGQCRSGAPAGPTRRATMQGMTPRFRPPSRRALVALIAPLAVACGNGGDDPAGGCGPITREALDSAYLVHVLGTETAVDYTSDPPTSGPHQPSPPVEGVVTDPITRPIQVGILERGDVLIQHAPDLAAADVEALEALAGGDVIVAPNPDLPAPVVATAWTYKRTCSEVDIDALEAFATERAGNGPED